MAQLNVYEQSLFIDQGNLLLRNMGNKYNLCASLVWLTELYIGSSNNSARKQNSKEVRDIVHDLEAKLYELKVKMERAGTSLNQAVDVLKNKSTYLDSAWNDGYRDEDEFLEMADSLLSYCNDYRGEMIRSIMEDWKK